MFTRPLSIAALSQTAPYDTFLFRSAARPIIRIGRAPIAFEVRHPFGAARPVPARRLQIGELFYRPRLHWRVGASGDGRRGGLPGAGIGRGDDERGRLRPARRDSAPLVVAPLRPPDRPQHVTRPARSP